MLYFFYQPEPETPWVPALASQRAAIIKEKNPAFCTVLDVDSVFDTDATAEEIAAARYVGPLYFDVDSEDLPTAIQQAQKLLTLIESKGVNLNQLRCSLTGGRGVHILMDQATFMPKAQPNGVARRNAGWGHATASRRRACHRPTPRQQWLSLPVGGHGPR